MKARIAASAWATSFSATSNARRCSCTWWTSSSATGRDPVEDFETVRTELALFDAAFAAKPQIVAANKIDAVDDEKRVKDLEKRAKKLKLPFFRISGVTGDGVPELLEAMWKPLAAGREAARAAAELQPAVSRR